MRLAPATRASWLPLSSAARVGGAGYAEALPTRVGATLQRTFRVRVTPGALVGTRQAEPDRAIRRLFLLLGLRRLAGLLVQVARVDHDQLVR